MALINHPDRVTDDDKENAKEKFSIIHQAYVVLSDSNKKQQYDNGCDVLFANATKSRVRNGNISSNLQAKSRRTTLVFSTKIPSKNKMTLYASLFLEMAV